MVLIVIVLAVILAFGFFKFSTSLKPKPSPTPSMNSFEDCAKAGNPILETYPRQCRTSDGKSFTEIINQESWDIAPCDVNADGKCDVEDLGLLNKALGTYRGQKDYIPLADLDADGVINDIDKQMLLKLLDQNQSD